jgi:hypothetical protein
MVEPIHPSSINELETATGPEGPKAAAKLAEDAGFKYRTGNHFCLCLLPP